MIEDEAKDISGAPQTSRSLYWRRFWTGRSVSQHAQPGVELPEFYRREAAVFRLLTGLDAPRRVLELGCAGGELYEAMGWESAEYTGIDISEGMLQRFRDRHPQARLVVSDAATFRDDIRQFDLILSNDVAFQFDKETFRVHLRNAKAMLAPNGVLVCGMLRWHAVWPSRLIAHARFVKMERPSAGVFTITRELYHFVFHTTAFRISELHRLAAEEGFSCEVFGSVSAPGTLHACLRHAPANSPA